MRINVEGATLSNMLMLEKMRKNTVRLTLGTTLVLTENSPPVLFLDSTAGNKNILLPAGSMAINGLSFRIFNVGSTGTLVPQTSTGGALTGGVTPGSDSEFIYDGNSAVWRTSRASTTTSTST